MHKARSFVSAGDEPHMEHDGKPSATSHSMPQHFCINRVPVIRPSTAPSSAARPAVLPDGTHVPAAAGGGGGAGLTFDRNGMAFRNEKLPYDARAAKAEARARSLRLAQQRRLRRPGSGAAGVHNVAQSDSQRPKTAASPSEMRRRRQRANKSALGHARYRLKLSSGMCFRGNGDTDADGHGSSQADDRAKAAQTGAQRIVKPPAQARQAQWRGRWVRRDTRCRLGSQRAGWHVDAHHAQAGAVPNADAAARASTPRTVAEAAADAAERELAIVQGDPILGRVRRLRNGAIGTGGVTAADDAATATATADADKPEADGVAGANTDAESGASAPPPYFGRMRRHPHLHGDLALEGATGASHIAGLGGLAPVPDVCPAAMRERKLRRAAHAQTMALASGAGSKEEAAEEARAAVKKAPAFGHMGGSGTCCGDAELAATVATFLHGVHAVKDRAIERRGLEPPGGFVWPRPNSPDPHPHVQWSAGDAGGTAKGSPAGTQFLPSFIRQTPGPGHYAGHLGDCFSQGNRSGSRRELLQASLPKASELASGISMRGESVGGGSVVSCMERAKSYTIQRERSRSERASTARRRRAQRDAEQQRRDSMASLDEEMAKFELTKRKTKRGKYYMVYRDA
eukprot:g1356.t1